MVVVIVFAKILTIHKQEAALLAYPTLIFLTATNALIIHQRDAINARKDGFCKLLLEDAFYALIIPLFWMQDVANAQKFLELLFAWNAM